MNPKGRLNSGRSLDGELRQKIADTLPARTDMLKIVMRSRDKSGKKPMESTFPWQPYEISASDKTIDALVDLFRSRLRDMLDSLESELEDGKGSHSMKVIREVIAKKRGSYESERRSRPEVWMHL